MHEFRFTSTKFDGRRIRSDAGGLKRNESGSGLLEHAVLIETSNWRFDLGRFPRVDRTLEFGLACSDQLYWTCDDGGNKCRGDGKA